MNFKNQKINAVYKDLWFLAFFIALSLSSLSELIIANQSNSDFFTISRNKNRDGKDKGNKLAVTSCSGFDVTNKTYHFSRIILRM